MKAKQLDKALELLAMMQQKGPEVDVIMYNAAISVCDKAERPHEVMELLAVMQLNGLAPKVTTFTTTLSAREKAM